METKLMELITKMFSDGNYEVDMTDNGSEIVIKMKIKDNENQEKVDKYLSNVGQLDDCVFVEFVDELGNHINVSEFDNLLMNDASDELCEMIDVANGVMKRVLNNKIDELSELLDKIDQ